MIEFASEFVSLFGFKIYYYGIILSLGALAGVLLAERRARKYQMDETFLFEALPWVFAGGVVGARLWHIFTPPRSRPSII